ncbi:unnamed protein product [Penicillium palitans]
MADRRSTTRFLDQEQMNALVIENRLDQVSEVLERAEGNKSALEAVKQTIQKDRTDIRDLRMIVCTAEANLRRQERLSGVEDRMNGLLKNIDRMLAAAIQDTRANQARTRNASSANSSPNPVGTPPYRGKLGNRLPWACIRSSPAATRQGKGTWPEIAPP